MNTKLPNPVTDPQSGVFGTSMLMSTSSLENGAAPLQLTYLPLAGDPIARVRCDGILTLRGRPSGADPLRDLLGARCFGFNALLSLEKVVGAETSGIAWLMQTGERFSSAGGKIVLYSVPAAVTTLFALLEMDLPFKIATNEADARKFLTDS